uniref:DNA gyrase subunit A n=1 Tax=Fagus sylvatica TaxID=28930 RepID=A0A2N9HR55_FAGSY
MERLKPNGGVVLWRPWWVSQQCHGSYDIESGRVVEAGNWVLRFGIVWLKGKGRPNEIRAQGRNTRGAVAMRLKNGDMMASMDIIPADLRKDLKVSEANTSSAKSLIAPWLLFVSESGFGKRVPLSCFRASPLNRVGLIGYKFSAEDRLAAVFVVGFSLSEDGESDEQVVLVSQSGTVNRIKVRDVSIQSRYARGVILMRLDHAGKIQSVSLLSATETEAEEEAQATAIHG